MDKIYIDKNSPREVLIYVHSNSLLLVTFVLFLIMSPFLSQVYGQSSVDKDFKFSGDFRLRYENTENQEPGLKLFEGRHREVVRFRAGMTKQINESLNFGARIATGSSDDPNTADVTLGNFVDDLEISLDQLYLEWAGTDFLFKGGKFPNPFRRTDLVWDGDVNPQGVSGSYSFSQNAKLTGMFSIIDEHSTSRIPDSQMFGGQFEFTTKPSDNVSFTLAGGYYDYDITSLTASHSDAGDTRSNNVIFDSTGAATAYVSDFDLLDIIAVFEYHGFGEDYPVRFVVDFVKNLGAEVDEDQGFMLDLFIGNASKRNDMRFRYGYSEAETDAMLAAFSNDNTTIASNYTQHTFTLDYVALDNTTLNLTWYLFKNKVTTPGTKNDLISRLRLNTVVKF